MSREADAMLGLPDADARARAVDPSRSVLVQAPAGSGKTTLLVERYLNLLERVERPEEILALTFTRKAASEMRRRILEALLRDDARSERIRARDRALDWQLAFAPQRLRIQTLDSFAYDVAAIDAHSSEGPPRIARDPQVLYEAAADLLFARLLRADPFHDEICAFLDLYQNDHQRARRALVSLLEHREQWLDAVRAALQEAPSEQDSTRARLVASIEALHRAAIVEVERHLTAEQRATIASIGAASAARLGIDWPAAGDSLRWRHAARMLITASGGVRRRFDARLGLPADDAGGATDRMRATALSRTLTRDAAIALAWLRDLPDPAVDDRELATLHPIAVTLALAANALGETFRARAVVDFAELTAQARRAFGGADTPSDLALALDYRVRHVLVDEFQDTSAAQIDLLRRVVAGWQPGDGRSFFGVGDPMQSIYRFRDADVSLYLAAAAEGIDGYPLEPLVLERNFRSRPAIVDWCNAVLGSAFGRQSHRETGTVAYAPASAERCGADGGVVEIACFASSDGGGGSEREASFLTERIVAMRAQAQHESIAVLVRNRAYAEPLLAALDAAGVAWHGADIRLLGDEPVVRDLLALLRIGVEPDHRLALLTLLRSPLVGLGLGDLLEIAERGAVCATLLEARNDVALSEDGAARVRRLRPLLATLPDAVAESPTRQWLENLWLRLGGADAYDAAALAQADALFALVERETPERPDCALIERALERLFARPTGDASDVQVMTIHRAKGLEFDHVIVPALDRPGGGDDNPAVLAQIVAGHALIGSAAFAGPRSIYDWLRRQSGARDANERIRLLYVAATRARRTLLLSAVASDDPNWSPDPRSLLAPIWPAVRADVRVHDSHARAGEPAIGRSPASPLPRSGAAPIARLPADYRWTPPGCETVP